MLFFLQGEFTMNINSANPAVNWRKLSEQEKEQRIREISGQAIASGQIKASLHSSYRDLTDQAQNTQMGRMADAVRDTAEGALIHGAIKATKDIIDTAFDRDVDIDRS